MDETSNSTDETTPVSTPDPSPEIDPSPEDSPTPSPPTPKDTDAEEPPADPVRTPAVSPNPPDANPEGTTDEEREETAAQFSSETAALQDLMNQARELEDMMAGIVSSHGPDLEKIARDAERNALEEALRAPKAKAPKPEGKEHQKREKTRGHHTGLDYHRTLLDDPVRMDAYERAIRELVTPETTVLDLGCGTGILSMLAAKRNAQKVYGVEVADVASLARELVHANDLSDTVTILHEDIVELDPPAQVDLVITDCMGRFLVDDQMLDAVQAARSWMKPSAVFCPQAIHLLVAPIADLQFWAVDFFRRPSYGLDLSPALKYALNNTYRAQLIPSTLLCDPSLFHTYTPTEDPQPFDRVLTFEAERDGLFQGFVGWFEASLTDSVVLSTAPGTETHWGQYLFPVSPVKTLEGDRIQIRLWLDDPNTEPLWRWAGFLERDGQVLQRFEHESEQRLGERERQ